MVQGILDRKNCMRICKRNNKTRRQRRTHNKSQRKIILEDSFIGITHQSPDNLFATKEEAIAAAKQESQDWVDDYKKEITDIASLVAFPLSHTFYAEEYTDYEAIRAYKERAKELGFEIQD